jgi:hypothetical protein
MPEPSGSAGVVMRNPMTKSLDQLRRDARALKRDFEAGEAHARQRLRVHPPRPDGAPLKHADYLHVIAQENNFVSWPALKLAVELHGMDKAAKLQAIEDRALSRSGPNG